MNIPVLDAIIIGAGQSGLSASYHLKEMGLEHVVLERGRTGMSWRSQRWDSFVLNSPNKLNLLPGMEAHTLTGWDPDGFSSAQAFARMLEQYATEFQLPVIEQAKVISVEKPADFFVVSVFRNNGFENFYSRQLIIASGSQSEKLVPAASQTISARFRQLHASKYRNANLLPEGAVLVVGSAQSGCQVADDLLDAGRKVYLATSMVGRIPRKYRGRDILDWLLDLKFFDTRKEDIDASRPQPKPPQLTGVDNGTRSISLQSLSAKGAVILGKLEAAQGKKLSFQPNAAAHVQFADVFSAQIKSTIDEFIRSANLTAPAAEMDEADTSRHCASDITSLNLDEENIGSIIWATGFTGNFDYIKLPVFDEEGNVEHTNGTTSVEGLYFMGVPWVVSRKSFLINGVRDDAKLISGKVYAAAQYGVTA